MEIGKYLPNVKGMENKVVTGLAGLVALGAIAVMPGDACAGNRAKEYGAGLIKSAIHSYVDQTVRNHVNRNRETVVNGVVTDLPDSYLPKEKERQGLSDVERRTLEAIKKIPRVVSIGDVDDDGVEDRRYFDGKGNCYKSKKMYKDANGAYGADKTSSDTTGRFVYWDNNNKPKLAPESVLTLE